jgi:hypothetical protein
VGVLLLLLMAVALVGQVISMPIFRAGAYRDLLAVEDGEFAQDIGQISFSEIPTLDRNSADYLGDRQMGTLSDMVSQFEYSYDSTQINYQGRPVRVAPIAYADLVKWFTNRGSGLPAYVIVDMVTQEAKVVRLPEEEGMKYSFSEPLNRNIMRHLRFQYPTFMLSTPQFEIDEEGQPWWIAPRIIKTIGLFGGTNIKGAVLCNAITGESQYYEEVPAWVDNVYTPDLIMEQYDYHGTLINGFINSVLGQRDVTVTTQGYNYIALNDDVYMYTGVTSANADQSNLGFLLSNQRTKETRFYNAPGATERAAQASAEGVVQDLGYTATFPILLNIANEPTYFIPLKDAANLVKSYAMVNVARYDIVATGPVRAGIYSDAVRQGGHPARGAAPDHGLRLRGRDPLRRAGGQHLLFHPAGTGERLLRPLRRPEPPGGDPEPWRPGDHHPCRLRHPRLHPGRLHPDGGRQSPVPGLAPHSPGGGASS